jgi:hypothetical protein
MVKGMDKCRSGRAISILETDNQNMKIGGLPVLKTMVVEDEHGEKKTEFETRLGNTIIADNIQEGEEIVLIHKWVRKQDLLNWKQV